MRSLAIAKRVITELLRDKRTLALMFVAPIIIILLLSFIFSANTATNVKIGAVDLPTSLRQNLDATKHVTVKTYPTQKKAAKALKSDTIDSIIVKKTTGYSLTYANTDASKTTATKLAFKNALTQNTLTTLRTRLVQTSSALTKLQPQSNTASASSTTKAASATTTKITNHYIYGDGDTGFFDKILPILLGFFVFFFVFLISGMALLKERTSGTLDRLLATPVKRSQIVAGYMISYGLLAVVQTFIIIMATIWLLGIEIVGHIGSLILINLILALVALAFGILVSTFARSEFQMVQFIPLIVIPQIFFSGIIPLDSMASWVRGLSYIMPIKYSGDASTQIMMQGQPLTKLGLDIGVMLLFLVILTAFNIIGLKRYRKV